MNNKWYKGKVLKGDQSGRAIGFPTANLSPTIVSSDLKEGVYACLVRYNNYIYKGALFFGPRLVKGETHKQLEIYILDFDQEIYGEEIEFKIGKYIREVRDFGRRPEGRALPGGVMGELKEQIDEDVEKILLLDKDKRAK